MWATNLKVIALVLAVVGFYTMVARMIPQLESDVPEELSLGSDVTPQQLAEAGERIFNGAGGCRACHGLGTRAPNLLRDHGGQGAIGARCGSRVPGTDCKEYLYESMTNPGAYLVDGFANIMPDARRQLPGDQIWAMIAFLQAQGGDITVTAEDLPSEGVEARTDGAAGPVARSATVDPRALLQENACLGCHMIDGAGPPIGPSFDGIGSRISSDLIRRAILNPDAVIAEGFEPFAGMMPKTYGTQLSAAQLEAIVRFLTGRKSQ